LENKLPIINYPTNFRLPLHTEIKLLLNFLNFLKEKGVKILYALYRLISIAIL